MDLGEGTQALTRNTKTKNQYHDMPREFHFLVHLEGLSIALPRPQPDLFSPSQPSAATIAHHTTPHNFAAASLPFHSPAFTLPQTSSKVLPAHSKSASVKYTCALNLTHHAFP